LDRPRNDVAEDSNPRESKLRAQAQFMDLGCSPATQGWVAYTLMRV
jgi:hypothetical protein